MIRGGREGGSWGARRGGTPCAPSLHQPISSSASKGGKRTVCACESEQQSNAKKATTYIMDLLLFKRRIPGQLESHGTYRMRIWRTMGFYNTLIPPPKKCLKIHPHIFSFYVPHFSSLSPLFSLFISTYKPVKFQSRNRCPLTSCNYIFPHEP
jgi:hypothetical protein